MPRATRNGLIHKKMLHSHQRSGERFGAPSPLHARRPGHASCRLIVAVLTPGASPASQQEPKSLRRKLRSKLLAIDVEFSHFRTRDERQQQLKFPAEVCVVDADCRAVLHAHCEPSTQTLADLEWLGGVPLAKLVASQSKEAVAEQVAAVAQGATLVGLGIKNDLQALGLRLSAGTVDLMQFPVFQNGSGSVRPLRQLAKQFLGRDIQQRGRRHSAREDAVAVMQLYRQQVLEKDGGRGVGEDELVRAYLLKILGGGKQ